MILQLLQIRFAQIKRAYIPPLSIYIIISAFVFYNAEDFNQSKSFIFIFSVFFLLYQFQLKRNDKPFVKRHFTCYKFQIAINYSLIILPITIGLYFVSGWQYSLLLHFLASVIPLTDIKLKPKQFLFLGKVIPPEHFEWISGLRRNLFIVASMLILALLSSPLKLFPLALLFLLNLTIMDFYSHYEPLVMLNPKGLSVEKFLQNKTTFSCRIFLFINSPILLINGLFNPEMMMLNTFFLIGFLLMFMNTVYVKYATYTPNESMRFHGDQLLFTLAAIIPYLIPLNLFLIYINHKKAHRHIKSFIT